jgi:hypothetical protein
VGVIEVFAPLFGHWQGTEELSASPWGAAGTARAALTFRAEIGGAAMVNDYRQVRDGGSEFLAHGVFLVAAGQQADGGRMVEDGQLVSWWLFDSYALAPDPATGGWRDGELVLTKTTPRGRAVHRFGLDGETLTYAIDVALGDADPRPFLRGRYGALSGH